MKEQEITARIILEIIGSPKEYIEGQLQEAIKKLENEDKINLLNAKTFESEELENKFWSSFVEIEFKAPNIKNVLDVCFDYTPTTLEILEPAGIELDTEYLAAMFNDLLSKMHQFIAVLKNTEAENILLKEEVKKLKQS
jgi:cell shape-determining protein MreC